MPPTNQSVAFGWIMSMTRRLLIVHYPHVNDTTLIPYLYIQNMPKRSKTVVLSWFALIGFSSLHNSRYDIDSRYLQG